ncbi:MAG TPA: hypothetical protein VIY51_03955 [Xanthobacteraceae bacterium]
MINAHALLRSTLIGVCATVVVVLSDIPEAAFAQACPTEQAGWHGFVVERGGQQKTSVFHDGDGIVRTVMRYNGATLLETTQYAGLFQLDRLDQGRRTKFDPQTDLKSLLPLKPGQTARAKFTSESEGRNGVLQVEMTVKGDEDLYIGACKFSVLKIERSESRSADPPRFVYTDYYSPMLKLILSRQYPESNGRAEIIKFDRVYAVKRRLFIGGASVKLHGRFRYRQLGG